MAGARTCIICGKKAGSREHVFPGAVGGRRTDKGIYCDGHNKAFAPLAEVLTAQLEHFNAPLGVVSDHTKRVRTVAMTDVATGLAVTMNNAVSRLAAPRFSTPYTPGEAFAGDIHFNSMDEAQAWAAAQRAKGMRVEYGEATPPRPLMLSGARGTIDLGGPEAFRAVGYVGQTFLAHLYPEAARAPGLSEFKAWTLKGDGDDRVWWVFDETADLDGPTMPDRATQTRPFAFAHRILVGVDREGFAYARVSFFSSLHFAMVFGRVEGVPETSTVVEIDPLAPAAPADRRTERFAVAKKPVERPEDLNASFMENVRSGRAVKAIDALLKRIAARDIALAVAALQTRLTDVAALSPSAREARFVGIVEAQLQRYWSIANIALREFIAEGDMRPFRAAGIRLDALVEPDLTRPDGLTAIASAGLERVRLAMIARFDAVYAENGLDESGLTDLLIGGETRSAILKAMMQPVLDWANGALAISSEAEAPTERVSEDLEGEAEA